MTTTRVIFLGSGDAFSAGGRHQAGYLVRSGDRAVLLDCGASTLTAMKQQHVEPGSVDHIVISHLHGDHFAGIPFLLLAYTYEQPRDRPLGIAGPPGIEARVRGLFATVYKEIAARTLPFALQFTELAPGRPQSLGSMEIVPFEVPHQERELSLGFRLDVGGRRIVYSGDTGWTDALIVHSHQADLFVCECCYFDTRQPFHLDYRRLAEHRRRFTAKRMILSHLGREVLERQNDIEMELARDGLVVEID
ncbi:MAG: MBL fold metallo-hydrolase [Candidatus Binatia bacterium]